MATNFKLSKDLYDRITTLKGELRDAAQSFRDSWDERSERWQESDAAAETDAWIESLEQLADDLEALPIKPDA